jgi:2-polyprenyl-3-methyl-5-hydroxy-6-metoxy-1,4-benzoquinol methylase
MRTEESDVSTQISESAPPSSASNGGKRIGILIVAYNAVTTLASVLRRIPSDVWENVEEVVVFDDASRDDTYELALGYKTHTGLDRLHVIKNAQNLGYGGNQKLGYQYFIDKGFDVVVLLHGDGQYAPEILADMYAPIVAGEADAVFGSRMMDTYGGALKGGMPVYKYVGNKILTQFENGLLGMNLTEFHSGYRAYNLHAIRQIQMNNMTNDFHFDTQIIVKLHHQGFTIAEVPIPTYYGDEICHVNGMKYALDVVKSVIRYKRTVNAAHRYPEYEEYHRFYPVKESQHSSHHQVRQLVGTGRDILDIGCAEGTFANQLVQDGNRVVGIDTLPPSRVSPSLDRYIQADVDQGLGSAGDQLAGMTFDRILLQDVLEHLRDPAKLLQECQRLLKPGGQIVVSIPNVANITVRLSLLLGRWDYTERGILDRTHVKFYTQKTARALLEENGYEITRVGATVIPVELGLAMSPKSPVVKILSRGVAVATKVMPKVFGYQWLLVAKPKSERLVAASYGRNGRAKTTSRSAHGG